MHGVCNFVGKKYPYPDTPWDWYIYLIGVVWGDQCRHTYIYIYIYPMECLGYIHTILRELLLTLRPLQVS